MRFALAAIALASLAASASSADQLDGRWCLSGGRRMSIDGPTVITATGARMQGEYHRGSLVYLLPGQEPEFAVQVALTPLDEERLSLATNRPGARPEIWHRCGPPMI
jgi:hypothetical protein